MKQICERLIETTIRKNLCKEEFLKLRIELSKKYKLPKLPSIMHIISHCNKKQRENMLKILVTKPSRTISGVTPIAVMTKPIPCPNKCSYCPGGPKSHFGDVPQSYTGGEPATMRAIRNLYDPYLQIFNRLEHYILMGHNVDKVELIVMGGTFPSFNKKYQEDFIKYVFKALNDFSKLFFDKKGFDYVKFKEFFEFPTSNFESKDRTNKIQEKLLKLKKKTTLEKEQKRNEKSKVKCISLVIETRPDYAKKEHINQILKLGCTRVELGIQSVYDDVLREINRGHTIKDSIEATKLLKDSFLKVSYHTMPGLPLTNIKKDINGLKELFSNQNFKPDMLKIYPTMVSKGTKLYSDYKKGTYSPLTTKQATKIILEFKKIVPEFCRIQRIQRDIPTKQLEAGVDMTNFRQYLHQNYNINCRCIRCREPRGKEINWNSLKIVKRMYKASGGIEIFISVEDTKNDLLIGFCRLRIPSKPFRKEVTKKTAGIRELHVYGRSISVGEKGKIQHKGLGKKLLHEAEKIAKNDFKIKKLLVISGIGVREYYRKLGYRKEGPYMSKYI